MKGNYCPERQVLGRERGKLEWTCYEFFECCALSRATLQLCTNKHVKWFSYLKNMAVLFLTLVRNTSGVIAPFYLTSSSLVICFHGSYENISRLSKHVRV